MKNWLSGVLLVLLMPPEILPNIYININYMFKNFRSLLNILNNLQEIIKYYNL